MKTVTAVIVAAGSGTRMGADIKKQFIEINGKPIIAHTIAVFQKLSVIDEIIVVTAKEDIFYMQDIVKEYGLSKVKSIVAGGSTRTESVICGLREVKSEIVAIHDGARPCVKGEDVVKTIEAAQKHGAAFLGVKVTDTIKEVRDGVVVKTVPREPLYSVQTPQCFKTEIIKEAYEKYSCEALTDDAMAVELAGHKVYAVLGDYSNIKITTLSDIEIAKNLL